MSGSSSDNPNLEAPFAEFAKKPGVGDRITLALFNWFADLGQSFIETMVQIGSFVVFSARMFVWLFTRLPRRETILPAFYQIGVLSLPVVALTGTFIGMVLSVQSYDQFRMFNLETRLGAVINMSLVRELGPVLAATMLAGRVEAPSPPNWVRCG